MRSQVGTNNWLGAQTFALPIQLPVVTVTSTGTTNLGNVSTVLLNVASGTPTVNLPSAATYPVGAPLVVKDISGNVVVITVAATGGQTIDGNPNLTIVGRQFAVLISDGSNWGIIGGNG